MGQSRAAGTLVYPVEASNASTRTVRESVPPVLPKPRLLDRVREALRVRHYSRRTEEVYVAWIRRYIFFHGKRHPAELSGPDVTRFLNALAVERRVAASTQNQALSALLFLYRDVLGVELPWLDDIVRAKRPERLPVVLSRDEVRALIQRLDGPPRLMAYLLYGAGLRVMECCRLRVQDVDFGTNQIVVRGGKGDKDRTTMLPAMAKAKLVGHLSAVRAQHQQDLAAGSGWVELPTALARKYPQGGRQWVWQWVFPATRIYLDRETGQRRRHHLHETILQRELKRAVTAAGIAKRASPQHAPSLVRDPLAGGRPGHPHRAGTPGPPRRIDDDDLHASTQPRAGRRPQPRRPDVQPVRPAARKFMADGIRGRDPRCLSPSEVRPGLAATRNGVREMSDIRTEAEGGDIQRRSAASFELRTRIRRSVYF
jgi:integron integrase